MRVELRAIGSMVSSRLVSLNDMICYSSFCQDLVISHSLASPGLDMNLQSLFTVNVISGLARDKICHRDNTAILRGRALGSSSSMVLTKTSRDCKLLDPNTSKAVPSSQGWLNPGFRKKIRV